MSVDDENFKAIEAKMQSIKKGWSSALGRACLDNAIQTLGPILHADYDKIPSPITSQHQQSISRGKK